MRRRMVTLVSIAVFCSFLLTPLVATAQLNPNSFSPVTWYNAQANNSYALAVGDLNNDGFADVVLSNQRYQDPVDNHTGITIYINNGNGTFHLGLRYPTDGFGSASQSVAISDVDGDGNPDLVVLNAGGPTTVTGAGQLQSVSVMRGNGDGTFQAAVSYLVNVYPGISVVPHQLAVADVNGDGKPDIFVTVKTSHPPYAFVDNLRGGVMVFLNHGDGAFASPILLESGGYTSTYNVLVADVNGDSLGDIVVTNLCSTVGTTGPCTGASGAWLPGTIGVLLGNGNGAFQPAMTYPSGGIVPGALAATDLNRDGKLDLLVEHAACFNCAGTLTAVLIGNGDGSFQAPVTYNNGASTPVSVAAEDMDGDGPVDAVVMNSCPLFQGCAGDLGTLSVLRGNGDSTLQNPSLYNLWAVSGLGYAPHSVVVRDLNNDGKPDVVVMGWTAFGVMLNQTPRAATTTALVTQPNPSGFGQTVTFSATVSSAEPGTPTGSVTFTKGVETLGTAPLVNGTATLQTSSLALGSHTVVARYSGDDTFRASVSAPLTQAVKAATATALASSSNPSPHLQSVTFTATLTGQFGGDLSGSVIFYNGSDAIGAAEVLGNAASFSTPNLPAGSHLITAVYSGDAASLGSMSEALNQTVSPVTPVTVTTLPAGLTIVVDGVSYTAPQTFSWAQGSTHAIAAASPQINGFRYVFMNWSDGGAAAHNVVTPVSAAMYTANFAVSAAPVPSRVAAWGLNANGQLGFADDSNFRPGDVTGLGPGSGIVQVAAGGNHSLALRADGAVFSWGLNNTGQAGDGSTVNNRLVPVQVSGLGSGSGVVAIAAGGPFSMALKADGTVLTWGQNLAGQLGDGTTTLRTVPGPVSGLGAGSGVIAIAAGNSSAYALKSDGTVLAWGNNANGQLGDGSTAQRLTPVQVDGLGAGSGVIAIASSSTANHVLALKSDGSVVAWGMNIGGQVGNGTTVQQTSPVAVSGLGSGSGTIALAAGGNHSLALKSDGSVVAWGANGSFQLGGGGTSLASFTPVGVFGLGPGSGVVAITAGGQFSMALKSGGTALAWGNNGNGQLSTAGNPCCAPTPIAVNNLASATALAAGNVYNLAVTAGGGVLSWGGNIAGQLGKNSIDANAFPTGTFNNDETDDGMEDDEPLSGIIAVSGGGNYSLALKSDGTVRAWGNNGVGQLGDGFADSTWDSSALQVRNSTGAGPLTNIVAIAAGSNNHSVALQSDGTVWAWGANVNGQLGDGTTVQKLLPVQVSGLSSGGGVAAISAGNNHTLALKNDGSVWAWGANANGRLGDGTTTPRLTPVQVSGFGAGSGVVALAAGNGYSLALKADGSVWSWGLNASGQLGDGTPIDKLTPIQVKDPAGTGFLNGVIAIAANGPSLALKSDGTVWAWGANAAGQLGDGTFVDRALPVQVVGPENAGFLTGAVAIAAGAQNGLAMKSDGTVWTWGFSFNGNLGDGTFRAGSPAPVRSLIASSGSIAAGSFHNLALVPVAPVAITFEMPISGLRLQFDGINFVTDGGAASLPLLPGTSFSVNTTSPQAGAPGTRYAFVSFAGNSAIPQIIEVPNFPAAYALNFATQHQLTTAVSPAGGGAITASPSSPDGYYNAGTSVQLTATPAPGYAFAGWSGGVAGVNPGTVTMDGPLSVTASVKAIPAITWNPPASISSGTPLSSLQLNATANVPGAFAYTPPAGTVLPVGDGQTLSVLFTPADSDNYTTVHAEVAITVFNGAPIAQNSSFATDEDTPFPGTLPGSDPDGDPLTFSIVDQPTHGSVTITSAATGAFTYTPVANYHGADAFTFRVTAGGENSNVRTVTITVTSVNDAPVAVNGALTTPEDTAANGTLSASDADGDSLAFSIVTPPARGTVTIPNPVAGPIGNPFIYTPDANYHGPDSFTFRVMDGVSTSATATISITVTPVNDAPVASDVFLITQEDVPQSGLLVASNVEGEALTYTFLTSPTKGVLTVTDPVIGAFTYTPNAGAFGYDTFSVRASDAEGASAVSNGQILIVANGPRWPGQTTTASLSSAGGGANNTSSLSAISADGRFIAFFSLATNLVAGDTNGAADVFVRDRLTGETTRVSVATGGGQGNGDSSGQAISADGRYVAFGSLASNLVAGDTNGTGDVFVRDRQTGQTTRVSMSTGGGQSNGSSGSPSISADGRYVTFRSAATNLVAGDSNGLADIFLHDRQTGQTSRVSVSSGGAQANGASSSPSISANGRFVSFSSLASNLVNGDINAIDDTFVRDLLTGQTTRVSVATGGGQSNDRSSAGQLSADGRYVAFSSFASNLVPGPTNTFRSDIFVHDRQTGVTTRVDVASDGSEGTVGASSFFSISADGRFVAFSSFSTNLVPGDTNATGDVFVRDRLTGQTTRVSVSSSGSQLFGGSDAPAISADGRFISFNDGFGISVAGGATIDPISINAPASGITGSVAVSVAYPGLWLASSTTPWITLAPPTNGTVSGSVPYTVAPNLGAARTGTFTVALQTVTVNQEAYVDVTPPTVTPPAAITVYATGPTGVTPAQLEALSALLLGATAVDDVPTAPVQQAPRLNGSVITSSTVFALGANVVVFSFTDAAGNVGTASSTVTVLAGRPSLSVSLVGVTVAGAGQQIVTVRMTNTGAGNALNLNVALSNLKTLTGTGTVTLASGLPAASPLLGPGQTLTLPILLNVPATVLRFSLSLALTTTDYTGALLSSAATLAIFPIDVTAPTILNNGPTLTPDRVSMTVTWQTSEPTTRAVAYGVGTSTNLTIPDNGVYATSHTVTLTGLVPNTTYSVIVSGHDPAGNTYVSIRKTTKTNP